MPSVLSWVLPILIPSLEHTYHMVGEEDPFNSGSAHYRTSARCMNFQPQYLPTYHSICTLCDSSVHSHLDHVLWSVICQIPLFQVECNLFLCHLFWAIQWVGCNLFFWQIFWGIAMSCILNNNQKSVWHPAQCVNSLQEDSLYVRHCSVPDRIHDCGYLLLTMQLSTLLSEIQIPCHKWKARSRFATLFDTFAEK
jgi:hypothetical protein